MKILVVGAGATGGYVGMRLAQAGRDVTFLVREQRAARLRERGLRLTGLSGASGLSQDERLDPVLVTAAGLTERTGSTEAYDLVLLTVKATGLETALADLAPAVGPGTTVLPVLNGMAHLDALDAGLARATTLAGLIRILATLTEDGDVRLMAPLAQIVLGPRTPDGAEPDAARAGQQRAEAVHAALDVPGLDVRLAPDALDAMWHKWVFIVAAGALTCLMRGPVGPIVDVPGGTALVRDILAEAGAVAAAAGSPVPAPEGARSLAMLSEPGSSFTSSLYRDLVAGRPTEAEHLLGDFTRRARELGTPTPLLDLALMQMRVAERQRTTSGGSGRPR